jgi:hypothetical protein
MSRGKIVVFRVSKTTALTKAIAKTSQSHEFLVHAMKMVFWFYR